MSILAHWALQKAIYQTLATDSVLTALVSGIYDNPPDNSVFPYVVLGECRSTDWSGISSNGNEVTGVIHIYSQEKGKKEASAIMERVAVLLHDADINVSGMQLVLMRIISASVALEKDGITYQGIIRCRALLQAV